MRSSLQLAAIAALFSTGLVAQGAMTSNCFISQFGTALNLGDDQVAQGNALGFTFPGPAGPVTSIDISSNGFVWLASSTDSGCCNGNLSLFLTGLPRIAPMWMDLNPGQAGQVWFNTIPAAGSQLAGAVVTWDGVPEYATVVPMTFQLQMYADGSFSFFYHSSTYDSLHDVLTGVTQGIAAVANPIDFATTTVGTPHLSGTNPTVQEEQNSAFDIADRMFVFLSNGTGGYIVLDRPTCPLAESTTFGVGCPKPATGYEFFSFPNLIDLSNTAVDFFPTAAGGFVGVPTTGFFTGYTGTLTFFDDQVQGPFALPFTFSYPGGSTNAIGISSNGFIWLQPGNSDSRCCEGDPTWFISDPASIAALWMDLYPPGGGTISFDVAPGNQEVHITWANVPEYYGNPPQTAQITLRSNGSFRLAYGTVANTQHSVLVGFTQGNSTIDPGSSDFSVGPVIIGAGGIPTILRAQAGSRPGIGSTFTMEFDPTPGSLIGIMVLGTAGFSPGIDLSVIGMAGCELYASLDVLVTVPLVGPPTPFSFVIPNNQALAGLNLYAQAATLVPALNPLGMSSSNGLRMLIGF
jgi:hypothetical protein